MNIYTKATTPTLDSTEYKLLNLTFCWLLENENKLDISYMHGCTKVNGKISYEELCLVHPELPSVIHELSDMCDRAGTELLERLTASVAHVLGSYINLNDYDDSGWLYPYLTNITAVRSTNAEGYFSITCLSYRPYLKSRSGLYLPHVNSSGEEMVTATVLDAIWPGASKHVRTMELLGYSNEDIVNTLLAGVPSENAHPDMPSLVFD